LYTYHVHLYQIDSYSSHANLNSGKDHHNV